MKSEDDEWLPSSDECERSEKRKRKKGRKRKLPLPVLNYKNKREIAFKLAEYHIGNLSVESKGEDDDQSVSSTLTRPSAPPDDDDMPMVSIDNDEVGRVYEDSLLDTLDEEQIVAETQPELASSPTKKRQKRDALQSDVNKFKKLARESATIKWHKTCGC